MRILLATDGTLGSSGAVRLAATLAADPNVTLNILHVLEPQVIYGPPSAHLLVAPDPVFAEERRATARQKIKAWLIEVGWPMEPRLDVEIGPVPATIVRAAEKLGADYILLGSGSHDRADRWRGTETAVHVIQLSHIPVLAIPQSASRRPRVVLAATDFSAFSRDALVAAVRLLDPGVVVHLAHVIPRQPPDLAGFEEGWTENVRDPSRRQLDEWVGSLKDLTPSHVRLHVLEGDVAEQLLKLAEQVGAELVVLGSHGLGFLGRLLLGSVSTRLLRSANRPLLIAPPREMAPELKAPESAALAFLE